MSTSWQPIPEISVQTLATLLATPDTRAQFIDVREPEELAIAHLDGFINLPLSQFAQWSTVIQQHLNPEQETFVLCHHGIRSAQMSQWLIQQGFTQVRNIAGGIHAYALQIDSTIPQY
jgi:rhodanese-related sulfurtransferase